MHEEIYVQVLYITQIIARRAQRDNSCLERKKKKTNPIIIGKITFFSFEINLFHNLN
jgi:hypothetical protein